MGIGLGQLGIDKCKSLRQGFSYRNGDEVDLEDNTIDHLHADLKSVDDVL